MNLPESPIVIAGWGAVSPAGWGAAPLLHAVGPGGVVPPPEPCLREGQSRPALLRRVPAPDGVPDLWREPRLRRASAIGRFAAHAALEALDQSGRAESVRRGDWRLGILFTTVNGCVDFSRRFFAEVLRDPAHASPILFPETVFNAPSSHLGAILGSTSANHTLLGDSSQFVAALESAARLLLRREVDGCLVCGAEEGDWLTAEGARWFDDSTPCAEGAGALYLERSAAGASPPRVVLDRLADVQTFSARGARADALAAVREDLEVMLPEGPGRLLCDGRTGHASRDAAESTVWDDWQGARISVRQVLGNGFAAATAWQSVIAASFLADPERSFSEALVSASGENGAAAGARLIRFP